MYSVFKLLLCRSLYKVFSFSHKFQLLLKCTVLSPWQWNNNTVFATPFHVKGVLRGDKDK